VGRLRKEFLAAALAVAGLVLAPAALGASKDKPRLARTVVVSRRSGLVRVKPVGARRFSVLTRRLSLPVGSTVDASHGKVNLVTAGVGRARTQSSGV
jgi:hypothetical protein